LIPPSSLFLMLPVELCHLPGFVNRDSYRRIVPHRWKWSSGFLITCLSVHIYAAISIYHEYLIVT
jgi:hypothetical protein